MKYRVKKCRGEFCGCGDARGGWHVIRARGLEKALICTWLGYETALCAALEFAGIEPKPVSEATC